MDINLFIFDKINTLVGKNKLLDAFGRAGAEWVIVIMLAWFFVSGFLSSLSTAKQLVVPMVVLVVAWLFGWGINIMLGIYVRENRPHITAPDKKILFIPFMNWKSFPSDHAMTALIIFIVAMIFHLPFFWGLLPLMLWVAWGRIYAGLHYPVDIVGGFSVAGLVGVILYIISPFLL